MEKEVNEPRVTETHLDIGGRVIEPHAYENCKTIGSICLWGVEESGIKFEAISYEQ